MEASSLDSGYIEELKYGTNNDTSKSTNEDGEKAENSEEYDHSANYACDGYEQSLSNKAEASPKVRTTEQSQKTTNQPESKNASPNDVPIPKESGGYFYGLKSSQYHIELSKTEGDATGIDWNTEFLELMTKLEKSVEDVASVYHQLARLANNFLDVAKTYGKIIINESSIPNHLKTIKPTLMGGLAGNVPLDLKTKY